MTDDTDDSKKRKKLINFNDIRRLYPQSIFRKKGYTIKTQKNFIKYSSICSTMLSEEEFTSNETKILNGMLSYMKLGKISSGCLTENGIPINKTRLMELLNNPNENTFDKSINRLEEKELIKRVRFHNGTIYFVNPFVFMNGEQIDAFTFALFYQTK